MFSVEWENHELFIRISLMPKWFGSCLISSRTFLWYSLVHQWHKEAVYYGPILLPLLSLKLILMVQYSKKLETQELEWLFKIHKVRWSNPWLKKISLPHSEAAVEAMVAIKALSFAQKLNLSSIILEGDLEIVIKALKSEDESFSSRGHLIAEAKLFFDFFHYFSLSHICRQTNSVAHNFTGHARHVNGLLVWMKDVPPHLNSILLADFG